MDNSHPIQIKKPLAGPACKAVIGFAAGILSYGVIRPEMTVVLGIVCAGILFLAAYPGREKTGNAVALAVLFFSGLFAGTVQHEINGPYIPPDSHINRNVIIEGVVTGNIGYYRDSISFELKCRSLHHGGSFYPADGMLSCTLYGKQMILHEGSRIAVPGQIRKYPQPLDRIILTAKLTPENPAAGQSIYRLTAGEHSADPVIVKEGGTFFGGARRYVSRLIDRYAFGGHGSLLMTMTIGDRRGLSIETGDDFARAGISHILAVSGLHVGILLVVIRFMLGIFPVSRNTKIYIILGVLFFFSGLCGFRPPVVRTFIMTAMVMAGLLFERRKNVENSLFVALLMLLAYDPQSLYTPSLQLSFAAVWAIVTFYRPIIIPVRAWVSLKIRNSFLNTVLIYFMSAIIVSVLAYAATAPIVAVHFGTVPLLSVIVNVPAVMLAMAIVTGGMFSLIFAALGPVAAPAAAVLSFVTGLFLRILSALAETVADIPFAAIETGGFSSFPALCSLTWLFILSRAGGRSGFKKALLYIPLVCVLFFTWSPLVSSGLSGGGRGTAYFFNVGQGDSALLEYDGSRYFLVDTGISSSARHVVVPSLGNMGIRSLDGIFVSHMDSDHIGGLDYILENIAVKRIFCRESVKDSLESVYGGRVTGISAGDSISFGEGGILVLSPFGEDDALRKNGISGENDTSLVLRFDMYGSKILFTGDIGDRMQRYMTAWDSRLRSQVMKIPHHGAKPFSEAFVSAAEPEIAVISCGLNNRYGHPAESTVRTLENYGITTLRTDRDGSMAIEFPQRDIVSF
ncbi:DNA internalization-related competence protein ComEC/Rec2 [Candidatus Latescibacterota bacterium]